MKKIKIFCEFFCASFVENEKFIIFHFDCLRPFLQLINIEVLVLTCVFFSTYQSLSDLHAIDSIRPFIIWIWKLWKKNIWKKKSICLMFEVRWWASFLSAKLKAIILFVCAACERCQCFQTNLLFVNANRCSTKFIILKLFWKMKIHSHLYVCVYSIISVSVVTMLKFAICGRY